MCTIGRTSAGTVGKAHHRADTEGNPIWGGQERTDCGSKRGRNSFLSTALASVALKSLVVETYDGLQYSSINVTTRENYEFLRDSPFKHVLLLQRGAAHTPGNSIGEGIARLYDEMDTLVGDELNVNIEQERGRLFFYLRKYHRWGSLTLYYFPVRFLESLSPVLRRITITFIHKLMMANDISTTLDNDDAESIFGLLSGDGGDNPQEWESRVKLACSYQEGKIGRLPRRVAVKSYYKSLPRAVGSYTPQDGLERQLVDAMRSGPSFLTPERGIMGYGYDAYYPENLNFHSMYLQQQIRVVYDIGNVVSEYLVDYYNSNNRETYDIMPVTTCDSSPDTEKLFRMDDYPERFFRWANKFINIVC